MPELRGRYVYPLGHGEDPVLLTEAQRDVLVDQYADHQSRAMWLMMILLLSGTTAMLAIILHLDMEVQFWMVLPTIGLAMLPIFTIRRSLLRDIGEFGPLPRVSSQEYALLRRERLNQRPWSSILLPALVLPFVALSLDPHFPPIEADDWVIGAFLLAIATVFVWVIARKLIAGRTSGA
jgi:hypothetical protein